MVFIPLPEEQLARAFPGTGSNEDLDILQYAKWGVDFLKLDNCNNGYQFGHPGYCQIAPYAADNRMAAIAIDHAYELTGTTMVLSESGPVAHGGNCGPNVQVSTYVDAAAYGNMWRSADDNNGATFSTFLSAYDRVRWDMIATNHGQRPGRWHDFDILLGHNTGNIRLSKVNFSMWAFLGSALLMGNNPANFPSNIIELYSNKKLLAVNQDPLGANAIVVSGDYANGDVVRRQLANGDSGVYMLNRSGSNRTMSIAYSDLALNCKRPNQPVTVEDLQGDSPNFAITLAPGGTFSVSVDATYSNVYRFKCGA